MKTRIIQALFFTLALLLVFVSACGSEEASNNEAASEQSDGVSGTNEENAIVDWPSEDITFVVPFSEGGSVDTLARGIASHWEKHLDYQIIIENRGGSGGMLGATYFLEQPDDGHTFFVGLQPAISLNMFVQDAEFSLEDFAFINFEQIDHLGTSILKESPYESIYELIDDIKSRPGEVSMGSIPGSGSQLFALAFIDAFDLDVNIVNFDGGGEMRTSLLGGHHDFGISSAYGDLPIKDEIELLTVSSEEPFPGWDKGVPIQEVLDHYNIDKTLPPSGDNRFIAVHGSFKENNPETFDAIVESYKASFESDDYQAYIEELGAEIISEYLGPEESTEIAEALHVTVEEFADVLRGEAQ